MHQNKASSNSRILQLEVNSRCVVGYNSCATAAIFNVNYSRFASNQVNLHQQAKASIADEAHLSSRSDSLS